jgi:RecA-family ATPase
MSWIDPDDPEAKPRQGPRSNGLDDPVQIHDASDIAMTEIPPRGWLLGTTFCRKFIAGLIAEGGAGKTAIRYAQYLACASGRNDVTGEHVHHRGRSLIVCLEDNLDEVRRRIGAAMLHHGVTPAEVRGFLFYCAPRGLKLLQTDPRGARTVGTLHEELRATIEKLKIDIVGIDPFVKAHSVEENDNNAIDQVCIMLADIGDEFDCAIDIVSHARKGAAIPGDADRDRGASAKKDAGRLIRTVTGMTPDEACLFGVDAAERPRLVRVFRSVTGQRSIPMATPSKPSNAGRLPTPSASSPRPSSRTS